MVDTTEFNLVPNNEEEEFTVDFGEVTRLAGSSDFNQLQNRPQYDGQVMTGETDIPKVPTATSELNNDSDYQTGSEVQQTINAAIADKQDKLTAGQNITISEQNVISATGLTEVDWGDIGGNLNDQIDLKDVLDAKQDTLTPGDNVTITNNTISATDTKYTAGNGLSLNGTQFSADTAVLQEKLDAGNAITIENNTINADIYPADFFTNEATDTDTGSNITLDKTIPATLKSVELYGDTEQQTYSGKNLFNKNALSNGWIDSNGNADTDSSWKHPDYISIQPSTTYTTSGFVNGSGINPSRCYYDSNKVFISGAKHNNAEPFTDTSPSNAHYMIECCKSGDINTLQIEQGSATAYEPYVGGIASPNPDYPQDVQVVTGEQTVRVSGKNLWKPAPDGTSAQNGITSVRENGVITLTGTSTGTSAGISPFYDLDTPLPAGTYTYSVKNALPYRLEFVMQDSSGTNHFPRIEANSKSGTITTTWETVKIRNGIGGYSVGTEINLTIEELQLEAGSTATDFTPFQTPQSYTVNLGTTELCKIGDYQDYIYKSGDDWYVHKEVNKHTFTGSENWCLQTSGTPSILYCGSGVLSDAVNSAVKTSIYSDHFYFTTGSGTGGCYLYNRSVFVFYGDTTTTAATFKTWLGNNNTAVYYPLATPTVTKITDAGLIADLNALAGAKSYLDVTNFTVTATGTNLPALLKPEVYVKSLHSIIELLNSYK